MIVSFQILAELTDRIETLQHHGLMGNAIEILLCQELRFRESVCMWACVCMHAHALCTTLSADTIPIGIFSRTGKKYIGMNPCSHESYRVFQCSVLNRCADVRICTDFHGAIPFLSLSFSLSLTRAHTYTHTRKKKMSVKGRKLCKKTEHSWHVEHSGRWCCFFLYSLISHPFIAGGTWARGK